MKVYVVKRPDGKYLTEMMDFTDKLIFANLFVDVESAWAYAPNDCRAVECFLMERDERTNYTKQVRKEVCEEIRTKLKPKETFHPEDEFEIDYDFYYKEDVDEILEQIQGDEVE